MATDIPSVEQMLTEERARREAAEQVSSQLRAELEAERAQRVATEAELSAIRATHAEARQKLHDAVEELRRVQVENHATRVRAQRAGLQNVLLNSSLRQAERHARQSASRARASNRLATFAVLVGGAVALTK